MNLWDFFNDWGGQILSIVSIIGSIFMYLRHDKTIKRQEQVLNNLQIKQLEKAEEKEKRAQFSCKVYNLKKGNRQISFINLGLSEARNVRIEIPDKENLYGINLKGKWGPYDQIMPNGDKRDEIINLVSGHTKILKLLIIWDDDFRKNNKMLYSVQL